MPTLREVQQAMRHGIVEHAEGAIADMVVGDGISPAERLRVYRGNYRAALVGALRLSYPAIEKLVGAECFDGCACQFVHAKPPQSPWLYDYGGEFSAFLATLPSLAKLSYLPDVARLEWAVNGALYALDHAGLDRASMAALADAEPAKLRSEPHPAVRLLRADFPADVIWRAVLQDDDATLAKIDLADGPQWLLVERGGDGIRVTRLSEGEWRFAAELFAGKTLDAALEAATEIDAPAALAGHLSSGRIAAASFGAAAEPRVSGS